ncbi:hypothetical protein [Vibrio hippocampi]|nr:hypothetical protein [Vibrio hippocampi]
MLSIVVVNGSLLWVSRLNELVKNKLLTEKQAIQQACTVLTLSLLMI